MNSQEQRYIEHKVQQESNYYVKNATHSIFNDRRRRKKQCCCMFSGVFYLSQWWQENLFPAAFLYRSAPLVIAPFFSLMSSPTGT